MLKLNLGCGEHPIEGWHNFDFEPRKPNITFCDLSKAQLPYSTGTVDYIFSEHFVEHLTKKHAIKLFTECHRVLKSGGVMRISMPNIYSLSEGYIEWSRYGKRPDISAVWNPESPCDMLNEGLREWGHQYLWDWPEASKQLLIVGFRLVEHKEWRSSVHSNLQNLEVRPYHNDLIIEAVKG